MNLVRRLVLPAGGIFLAALLIAALAPRAVHAVAAALVRDVDNPARHPFTTACSGNGSNINFTLCQTPAIPTGEEVVIESVSIAGIGDPGNFVGAANINTTVAGVGQNYSLNPIFDSGLAQPAVSVIQGIQPLRLYADPGTAISCELRTRGPNSFLQTTCAFSGYTVSLP